MLIKKIYKVKIEDDSLSPEESLLEAISPDSKIERPVKLDLFVFLYFLILGVFLIFLFFGVEFQIIGHKYFYSLAEENKSIKIPISPKRGLIYSKEGVILADNKDSYELWLIPSKLKGKENLINEITEILGIPKITPLDFKSASILIKENLSKEEIEKLKKIEIPGLFINKTNKRIYPQGEAFSHLIGYIGKVSEDDLMNNDYELNDLIGLSGIERYYEKILRGRRGNIFIDRFEDEIKIYNPEDGESIVLNINASLQEKLYSEIKNAIKEIGSNFGAGVAFNPRNGEVLALVSYPSFDNNKFIDGWDPLEFKKFEENKNKPFLNRVISGKFSPGSTIKPLIALAALEENIISPEKLIHAPGFINIQNPYNPDIIYTFRDWRNHGWVNLKKAIAYSSDIYFYTIGGGYYDINGLGIERIAKYLKLFKIDSILGIDLPGEVSGFVPTPEWKKSVRKENWYKGDTFNVSIGQGDLLVTPLWLVSYIGAIGNGENFYKPLLISKILDKNGNIIKSFEPELIFPLPFKKENIAIVKEGMKLAAEEGTAKILKDLPFEVGAKTGTAEVIKGESSNSWVVVFAPYQDPEIALLIFLDSGLGGTQVPTQIAYRILREYFK